MMLIWIGIETDDTEMSLLYFDMRKTPISNIWNPKMMCNKNIVITISEKLAQVNQNIRLYD